MWTDIAVKNIQLLADLRQTFPTIQSFLLDKPTFEKYQNIAIDAAKEEIAIIAGLTVEEQQFLLYLNNLEGKNRLLQKHISQVYLKKRLKQV